MKKTAKIAEKTTGKNVKTSPVAKPSSKEVKPSSKSVKKTKIVDASEPVKGQSSHGFAKVENVIPITMKTLKAKEAREMSLRDFVLGALTANPELDNEELFELVQKAGRENAKSTTGWYAARVRQGHIVAI